MAKQFQLVAGHLALDFANTLDFRYDERRSIELLSTYGRFLEFAAQAGLISTSGKRKLVKNTAGSVAARKLKQIVEIRETLYRMFLAAVSGKPPHPSCLRTYNGYLRDLHVAKELMWRKSGFMRSSADLTTTSLGPIWPILESAGTLLTSPDRSHIRECGDESCRWFFLDTTKNHSRRWCSMDICGSRDKARRYYARRKVARSSRSSQRTR
jgi:predicted RNA-binding Zn ribbon-like protein